MQKPATDTPAISVLIPVYNVERFLPRCLDSVLAQTFTDFEVICVNDASPDTSAVILAAYAASDPRIRIITHPSNLGLMMARKTGYTNACGKYLFFLDADDYIPDYALAALYRKAIATGADITVGEMQVENSRGNHVSKPRIKVSGIDSKNYLRSILSWTTPSLCGSLFQSELLQGYDYTTFLHHGYSEDRILLTQILVLKNPSIATIPDSTYFYYINQQSITHSKLSDKNLSEQFKALFWCYDYLEAKCPGSYTAFNNNFIIRYLSLYIERGCNLNIILGSHPIASSMLDFNKMRQFTSTRFAIHTRLCLRCIPYRIICTTARHIIRKLQGKI